MAKSSRKRADDDDLLDRLMDSVHREHTALRELVPRALEGGQALTAAQIVERLRALGHEVGLNGLQVLYNYLERNCDREGSGAGAKHRLRAGRAAP